MPKTGKMMRDGGSMAGGVYGDGSRNSMGSVNMNGRIDPGMTPAMSQPKTKMSGMPIKGQTQGSPKSGRPMAMGDSARKSTRGGGY